MKISNELLEKLRSQRWTSSYREGVDELEEIMKCALRLRWLHTGGERDAEGFEWGVFRVKWDAHGRPSQVWQTNSDFSDLDEEIRRGANLQPNTKVSRGA